MSRHYRSHGRIKRLLANRAGSWLARHKKKLPVYIPAGIVGWYLYGMFLNSLQRGINATFHADAEVIQSIWEFSPVRNWLSVFTPFGLSATAIMLLLICLITKKGYIWFSGYKFIKDERGFNILPDGTHGTSGFLTEKEMRVFLAVGPVDEVKDMLVGKYKRHRDDPDKYALYVAHRMKAGDNNSLLCIGAPGSGKTRGFIIPFLLGCAERGESVFVTDPKGELFEKMSRHFEEKGYYVKAVNFLDMEHSDGWNCLYGLDTERQLVQTVANTIIQNTSSPKEADDFWARAELNLLMALLHYVCNLKDGKGNLLPIEQRSIGAVYRLIANDSINELNRKLAALPPDHPAKGHHGLFLKAKDTLWSNIITGLGNRLSIYQNALVDKITSSNDVDLVLPGKQRCAYFVIISAQDSAYRFLSSLFFSLAIPQLSDYARLHGEGGRLPVMVNFCLDEYCNIGYMEGMADSLNSIRGFNMSCQVVVQSLSQWQEKYPGKEWENQLATFDQTLYMGCNDLTSAKYISEKCGKITIAVTNNQMPLAPLFSPVYSTTRPYSQTKSNTQRDLMLPDEILRLDREKCIVLFQGHKPAMLYKLAPENIPAYAKLKSTRIIDYIPEWKRSEARASVTAKAATQASEMPTVETGGISELKPERESAERESCFDYDFSEIEPVFEEDSLAEASALDVLGMEEDEDEECPPHN